MNAPEGFAVTTPLWDSEPMGRALGVPVLLVSNEIGCGVMPMGREVRACVDALGALHKAVAARCDRLTLMVAGYELRVK